MLVSKRKEKENSLNTHHVFANLRRVCSYYLKYNCFYCYYSSAGFTHTVEAQTIQLVKKKTVNIACERQKEI